MRAYTGNQQFDFQIMRFTDRFKDLPCVQADLTTIGAAIQDFETWYNWWWHKACAYEAEGQLALAARYYRAAAFYLDGQDPRKEVALDAFQRLFYQTYEDFAYERHNIPYQGHSLPALKLTQPQATRTLLVMGGFDGILEELCDFVAPLQGGPFNILLFDGPGQGRTYEQGLTFQPDYEVPVKAVLDYFQVATCDALGLSWGGYFVLRAAAFEPRIRSVVTLDIFYSAMDGLRMTLGPLAYAGFRLLYRFKARYLINGFTHLAARFNTQLNWSLQNGYQLTGEHEPYAFFRNLDRHQVAPILSRVTQPCLLLAGQDDQYVPAKRLPQMVAALTQAQSVASHLFTRASGGQYHCQIGRLDLAYEQMRPFWEQVASS